MSKRKNKLSRHHLLARSRGGDSNPYNILMLWRKKHDCWHTLFGNKTLDEIIEIMCRVRSIKARQRRQHGNEDNVSDYGMPSVQKGKTGRRTVRTHARRSERGGGIEETTDDMGVH